MTARALALALFALWAALAGIAAALSVRGGEYESVALAPALVAFAAVGAIVAVRRPGNPIGWLLEAIAIVLSLTIAVEAYLVSAKDPALIVLWLSDWAFVIWIVLACVWLPLLFPDGRLPSRRWRAVAIVGSAAFALGALARAFGVRTLETESAVTVENPYVLPGVAGEIAAFVASMVGVLYVLPVLTAVAGLVVRTRRSRGLERQQLKAFALVGALMLGALLLSAIALIDEERLADTVGVVGWGGFLLLLMLGLPVAIGTSILRHRLYDIDVVINRALVYGALTVTLGATYLAIVLLVGLAVGQSDLAVAGSTLAVAALVRPARSRIQGGVDHRFFRRRYDAAQTLEAFAARLRDEVDLDALHAEIRGVVQETVQPVHVSLWLRESPR